jgi:hypothetical protein
VCLQCIVNYEWGSNHRIQYISIEHWTLGIANALSPQYPHQLREGASPVSVRRRVVAGGVCLFFLSAWRAFIAPAERSTGQPSFPLGTPLIYILVRPRAEYVYTAKTPFRSANHPSLRVARRGHDGGTRDRERHTQMCRGTHTHTHTQREQSEGRCIFIYSPPPHTHQRRPGCARSLSNV